MFPVGASKALARLDLNWSQARWQTQRPENLRPAFNSERATPCADPHASRGFARLIVPIVI